MKGGAAGPDGGAGAEASGSVAFKKAIESHHITAGIRLPSDVHWNIGEDRNRMLGIFQETPGRHNLRELAESIEAQVAQAAIAEDEYHEGQMALSEMMCAATPAD